MLLCYIAFLLGHSISPRPRLFFNERVYIKSPYLSLTNSIIYSAIICEYPFDKFEMSPFYRRKIKYYIFKDQHRTSDNTR